MSKFRKKPVVVEAMQFKGDVQAVIDWVDTFFYGDPDQGPNIQEDHNGDGDTLCVIETLEGDMSALPGDWIIRGVKGEFYPCKPDIFEATYEAVEG